jgi:glucose-1-phosphate adenylyltransferase
MGGDIIPALVERREAAVYDFTFNHVPGSTDIDRDYWRDVGTLDSYHEAHMDLVSAQPAFSLYNSQWPIYTWNNPLPPAKFVHETEGRVGRALNSMVCGGVIISGGEVRNSVLSPEVRINSYSTIDRSVLMHGVKVGRHAVVRNAIIDKNVNIPEGAHIGVDLELDRERFTVSPAGVVAIGKNQKIN